MGNVIQAADIFLGYDQNVGPIPSDSEPGLGGSYSSMRLAGLNYPLGGFLSSVFDSVCYLSSLAPQYSPLF